MKDGSRVQRPQVRTQPADRVGDRAVQQFRAGSGLRPRREDRMPGVQITNGVIRDPGDGRVGNRVTPDEIGGAAQILPAGGTDGGGRTG